MQKKRGIGQSAAKRHGDMVKVQRLVLVILQCVLHTYSHARKKYLERGTTSTMYSMR